MATSNPTLISSPSWEPPPDTPQAAQRRRDIQLARQQGAAAAYAGGRLEDNPYRHGHELCGDWEYMFLKVRYDMRAVLLGDGEEETVDGDDK